MSVVCHKCGRVNGERYKFCLGCGAPIEEQAPEPTRAPVPAKAAANPEQFPVSMAETLASEPGDAAGPVPPEGMKFCTSCGAKVPIDFTFCGRCGTRFDTIPPARQQQPPAPEPVAARVTPAQATTESDMEGISEDDLLNAFDDGSGVQNNRVMSPVRGKLVLIHPDGSMGDAIVLVDGDNVLGRRASPSMLADDVFVSPEHVKVQCEGGHVLFEDLGSLNGTFLRLTRAPVVLQHGDVIRIGQQLLRFEYQKRKLGPARTQGTDLIGSPSGDLWGTLHRLIGPHGLESTVYAVEGDEITVGRETGNVTFRGDGFVSGRHARIYRDGDRAILEDLGSSNGTYIRLRNIYQAQPSDLFLIGQQLFQLELR